MALTSFYGQMLLLMQARIEELVPEIRYIDQDLGQLDIYSDRPAVSFPCVLIDFSGTNYDQLSGNVEMGTSKIRMKLAFAPFSSANSLGSMGVREKALNYYECEALLYKAFKGWDADGLCQPLNRVIDGTEKRDDAYRVRIIDFETSFEDDSATPEKFDTERPRLEFDFED